MALQRKAEVEAKCTDGKQLGRRSIPGTLRCLSSRPRRGRADNAASARSSDSWWKPVAVKVASQQQSRSSRPPPAPSGRSLLVQELETPGAP